MRAFCYTDIIVLHYPHLMEYEEYEGIIRKKGFPVVAGIDEAGRGPLAGPVVAASAIISPQFVLEGVNDSKKLTPKKRKLLFEQIIESDLVNYGVGIVDHARIDEINILEATKEAMRKSVEALEVVPDYLMIDGNFGIAMGIEEEAVVKGDGKVLSIAVASIIAKETRDRIMQELDTKYPQYGLGKHMGYPTKAHVEAINQYGPTPVHRMSFAPLNKM